jgi:uncharacterized membrane protein YczE
MKLSSSQKAMGIVLLVCMLLVGIFAFVSAFITHSDQPATYGGIGVIVAFSISIIIVGLVQVGSSYARGEPIVWYKQYEVPLGLFVLSISLVLVLVSIFQSLPANDPSRLHYYLEMATLLLCPLLGFFFLLLVIKYKPINRD